MKSFGDGGAERRAGDVINECRAKINRVLHSILDDKLLK